MLAPLLSPPTVVNHPSLRMLMQGGKLTSATTATATTATATIAVKPATSRGRRRGRRWGSSHSTGQAPEGQLQPTTSLDLSPKQRRALQQLVFTVSSNATAPLVPPVSIPTTNTFKQAIQSPFRAKWKTAMERELQSLEEHQVADLGNTSAGSVSDWFTLGKPLSCAEHSLDTYRDDCSKVCEADGCSKHPIFGLDWGQVLVCSSHNLDNLMDAINMRRRSDTCTVFPAIERGQGRYKLEGVRNDYPELAKTFKVRSEHQLLAELSRRKPELEDNFLSWDCPLPCTVFT